jgi:predicted ribosome quality control (RQC) complex YloA/Tae2 family protein
MNKKELTSIEIRFLVKELQDLISAKIDQIYQPKKNELILQLHRPNKGKKLLRIILPSFAFLTSLKKDMPKDISEFCKTLREHINNARIRKINQIKNERIIELVLEKEKKYSLMIELFSKGNIILCENNKILRALFVQKLKERIIKKDKTYKAPLKKYHIFEKSDFEKAIKNSKDTISKTLAVTLGLGKKYAEELCLRAGLNKLNKGIKKQETEKLFTELEKLGKQAINPQIIFENKEIVDIVPIKLQIYSDSEQKEFKQYNEALAFVLDKLAESEKKSKAHTQFTKKLEKIETKITKQKETLAKLKKDAQECQRKGELIYENYQKIKEVLTKKKKGQKVSVSL